MELARHLHGRGDDVHVVARRVSSSQKANESVDGVEIHRIHRGILYSSPKSSFANMSSGGSYRGSTPKLVWKLYEFYLQTVFPLFAGLLTAKLVRDKRLDVILERESSFGAGIIASIITGRPVTLEVIGNRVTKFQLRHSKKIIAYSRSMFEGLVDQNKIETISAAVDTDLFRPNNEKGLEIKRSFGLESGMTIGYVGTFQEWHGIDELLECAKLVVSSFPKVKFLMVGPYFRQTKEKTEELGLQKHFLFTGPVPYQRVPDYIAASDILLAPYNPAKIISDEQVRKHGLGSPLKVFEYLSAAKPVITTSVVPISEIIDDHVNGLLIKPGDSKALGDAILELLTDVELADSLGRKGRELVLEKYSWDMIACTVNALLGTTTQLSHHRGLISQ